MASMLAFSSRSIRHNFGLNRSIVVSSTTLCRNVHSQMRHLRTSATAEADEEGENTDNNHNSSSTGTAGKHAADGGDDNTVARPPSRFVLTAAAVRPPPPLPHFDVDYEQGTGRFTLVGKGPCEGCFVSCTVSAQHKPKLLQLGKEGGRGEDEAYGVDEEDARASEAAKEQLLYHKHLWTSAQQRLHINRRKLQKRREELRMAKMNANRAATLEAFLQQQSSQNYSTNMNANNTTKSGGSSLKSVGKVGKLSLMCPSRSDPVPPKPELPIPPPPSTTRKYQQHQNRFTEAPNLADNNPHNVSGMLSDPFEAERDLHRRQYLALDGIVAEDGAEQVGVQFRVGILARSKKSSCDASAGENENDAGDEADVIADFMESSSSSSSQKHEGEEQIKASLKDSSTASSFRKLMLHMACSTIAPAAALSIDAIHFLNDPTTFFETSVETTDEVFKKYLGPQLHQRHLGLYACNREGQLNRYLFPVRSGHLDAVSIKNFFRHDIFPEVSIADKGLHAPVHTVPSALHDSLRVAIAKRGIDDELSLYMHRYAQYVFAHERLLWRQRVVSFLKRGRLTKPSSADEHSL